MKEAKLYRMRCSAYDDSLKRSRIVHSAHTINHTIYEQFLK